MKTSSEFKVGKHSIGWVDSSFLDRMPETFEEGTSLPFQQLPRVMTDAEILKELNVSECNLGDVIAFLKNPPEGTKDGYWNLFYMNGFVVRVSWYAGGGGWDVGAWSRGSRDWVASFRVFSPATDTRAPQPSELGDFVPRAEFDTWKNKVEAVLKLG